MVAVEKVTAADEVVTADARTSSEVCDFWLTDPPYADAVNYHELGAFFLAWYDRQIPNLFPNWYTNSRPALAVKGRGASFNEAMVACYRNLALRMPDHGAQVVMFTHQDSGVWADLALILWAAGLRVTAAWTIQTETDAVGIKTGNYVQGTVLLILRKQTGHETGFLSDIQPDVEYEVRRELTQMIALDDQDDPNFSDTDYQLAAYVAALRVLTGYQRIEDLDVAYELTRQRRAGEVSQVQKIIDSAVRIACEELVPAGFTPAEWRPLSAEERFYVKALELQSHGEFRTGVLQELARGFGLRRYDQFLHSGRANDTRLATPTEYGRRQLLDNTPFGNSLLRHTLFAVRETAAHDSPRAGRQWLHNELPDGAYWALRQRILHLLGYFQRHAATLPAWDKDLEAARLLEGYLRNDAV